MTGRISLRCQCGAVRGDAIDVSPRTGNRLVCYCDDCQAFAHHLGRTDVLDEAGGTDIFQLAPAQVRITEGVDGVRCIRLSPKGLFRWYAACCRTPLANTASARFPFVGLLSSFMDHAANGRTRDQDLGPPFAYVQGRYAVGGLPAHVDPNATTLPVILRIVRLLARWWITGRGTPSPFFDPTTRAPIASPEVLRLEQRETLRAKVAAAIAAGRPARAVERSA
jgi:hypothetical protein